jgi:hypothetical protein
MLGNKLSKALTIQPLFDCAGTRPVNLMYRDIAHNVLQSILPERFLTLSDDAEHIDELHKEFSQLLPIFKSTPCPQAPLIVSFFSLSKFRPNAFNFFFEMISHWLVPGKRLNVLVFYGLDFQLPEFGNEIYTLSEVMIQVESEEELEELRRNLPIIESEVRMGIQSPYYARRILEIKGLNADAKTAMVQEFIASLITRLPKEFDHDVLNEMQHILVTCPDDFKSIRDTRHLSRIIYIHYLFRKSLWKSLEKAPEKRHLSLKLLRATLHLEEGNKNVLGILVGVNFLSDKEAFEERHLISAIQNYIPSSRVVENSFIANRRGSEQICTLYLEIEKSSGTDFTTDEILMLRRELPNDLKDRIEHLMHPIFMPRNDEEIMRNIFSLSNQIKFWHDHPEVIISFEQQLRHALFFTIILVRVRQPGSPSIQEMFQASSSTSLEYIHDRAKAIGYLRKKYAKEAVVFGVKIPKQQFLRRDHSIDLNQARQAVVAELTKIIGEFRDYNGGMITKQNELFCALREVLGSEVAYDSLLLENFFYSLTPDAMRTVLEPALLKTAFLMLLESIKNSFFTGENYCLKVKQEAKCVFAIIKTDDPALGDQLSRALSQFEVHSSKLARSLVSMYEAYYTCYLYFSTEPEQQQLFINTIETTLKTKK